MAVDEQGRVYIADTGNHRVRRVDQAETITTIAGTGQAGVSPDTGPATSAPLTLPRSLACEADGSVLIGDQGRIRRVSPAGMISLIAGASSGLPAATGRLALNVRLGTITGVTVDAAGRVVFTDPTSRRVLHIETDGSLLTLAGGPSLGPTGIEAEGGLATSATLDEPAGVVIDDAGRLIFADRSDVLVWTVELDDTLARLAGTGSTTFVGDGGLAVRARMNPSSVAVDAQGRIFIAESGNHRVRRVDSDGTITTVVGTGVPGDNGDFIPGELAQLSSPTSLTISSYGDLIIADSGNHRVRALSSDGFNYPFAGTGDIAFTDSGVPAVDAYIEGPDVVAADGVGNVYINSWRDGIYRVESDGYLYAVAAPYHNGIEIGTYSRVEGMVARDNGSVIVAAEGQIVRIIDDTLETLTLGGGALALSASDELLSASDGRVRRLETDATFTVLAGVGTGIAGDGGAALDAQLNTGSLTVDGTGRMLVAGGDRVRRIELDDTVSTVAGPVQPLGPGPFLAAKLYPSRALAFVHPDLAVSVGDFGRVVGLDFAVEDVDVVFGYDEASPDRSADARYASPLQDARGVAFDPSLPALVVTKHATSELRRIFVDPDGDGDIDDPATWTTDTVPTDLVGPAGITYEPATDTYLVVEEANHCLRRLDRTGALETVFGRCGVLGSFAGYLNSPTHAAISPTSGAIYVADTGNHRVLRVVDGVAELVIGDGSISSAGEGEPARLFPTNTPRQLAVDEHGNLYVTSTTTVRLIANVDGDLDADGDDRVTTTYGGGDRADFPESTSFCVHSLALRDDDNLFIADACQGFVVRLGP